jgi:hypothetical protein
MRDALAFSVYQLTFKVHFCRRADRWRQRKYMTWVETRQPADEEAFSHKRPEDRLP